MADESGSRQRRTKDEDGEGRRPRSSGTRKKGTTTTKSRGKSTRKTSSGTQRGEGDGQKSKRRTKDAGAEESPEQRREESQDGTQEGQASADEPQQEGDQGEQASADEPQQEGDQGEQAADGGEEAQAEERAESDGEAPEPPRELSAVELVKRGKELLAELTGYRPESVSGIDRHDGGWRLTLEVVELNRIPPTTDVLGTYQLDMTEGGELTGYRRVDRYYRNQAQQRGE